MGRHASDRTKSGSFAGPGWGATGGAASIRDHHPRGRETDAIRGRDLDTLTDSLATAIWHRAVAVLRCAIALLGRVADAIGPRAIA